MCIVSNWGVIKLLVYDFHFILKYHLIFYHYFHKIKTSQHFCWRRKLAQASYIPLAHSSGPDASLERHAQKYLHLCGVVPVVSLAWSFFFWENSTSLVDQPEKPKGLTFPFETCGPLCKLSFPFGLETVGGLPIFVLHAPPHKEDPNICWDHLARQEAAIEPTTWREANARGGPAKGASASKAKDEASEHAKTKWQPFL